MRTPPTMLEFRRCFLQWKQIQYKNDFYCILMCINSIQSGWTENLVHEKDVLGTCLVFFRYFWQYMMKYLRRIYNIDKIYISILRVKIYQYLWEDFELSCVLVDSLCLDFVFGVLAGSRGIRPILSPLSSLDLSPPSEVPSNGQVPRGVSTLAWGQRSTCWYTTLYCLVVDSTFR